MNYLGKVGLSKRAMKPEEEQNNDDDDDDD
jgi:hypothetical protein